MNKTSDYLLECDMNFYRNYALQIIKNNPKMFDLDGFESILHENILSNKTIKEFFYEFKVDKSSQYELNPMYGRYVSKLIDIQVRK